MVGSFSKDLDSITRTKAVLRCEFKLDAVDMLRFALSRLADLQLAAVGLDGTVTTEEIVDDNAYNAIAGNIGNDWLKASNVGDGITV